MKYVCAKLNYLQPKCLEELSGLECSEEWKMSNYEKAKHLISPHFHSELTCSDFKAAFFTSTLV